MPHPRTRTVITTSGKPGMTMATIEEVEEPRARPARPQEMSPEARSKIAREMRAIADRVEAGDVVAIEYEARRAVAEVPAYWSIGVTLG